MSIVKHERVLVTGASGFIGSAVVRRLARTGAEVIATARTPSKALEAELGTSVSKLDVMQALPSFEGVQTIVHCATPNDIHSRATDGGLPLGVMGTRYLLEHAANQGVRRVVYLSTLQVYGTELKGYIDEATPVACETLYGLNHYLGEEVCRYFTQRHGLDILALRPSNVYGVPLVSTVDRWTLVPMCFVREAAQTGTITLKSSGKQWRNFVSLNEVTDVIERALNDFPKGYAIANVGSNWRASIAEIASMVAEVWLVKTGQALHIDVQSDAPKTANEFHCHSRLFPSALSQDESRAQMSMVIEGLVDKVRAS